MSSFKNALFFTLAVSLFAGCTVGSKPKDGTEILTNQAEKGAPLAITLTRGNAWMHIVDFGFMKTRITPQMAIWVEDTNGTFLKNLYVTHCFAKQEWKMVKTPPDSCNRTMCMPYWLNKMVASGLKAPTPREPLADAVTGATPAGSFTLKTRLPEGIQKAVLCLEINKSFDNNYTWKKGKMAETFNGQPAIVYRGTIDLNSLSEKPVTIPYYGRSGETIATKNVTPDSNGLTTALQMLQSISVTREN